MSAPPRHCLVVRCGDPEPEVAQTHGCFVRWFRHAIDASVELSVLDPRVEAVSPDALEGIGAVVITGSPHAVFEPHPWIPSLEALVREAVTVRELPLLGVCFGHQLLAQSFGGEVTRNPRGREMGTITVRLNDLGRDDALFHRIPHEFRAHATHRDTVLRAPPSARVLASSDKDGCQSFKVGRHAWGVQFHPEITAPILRGYVRAREAVLRGEGACPVAVHDGILDTVEGATVLGNFIALAFGG
jgi:GMP synthase (glutamine-hydrolysing)